MAGRGRVPKPDRRNPSDVPTRGEWTVASGVGWQHGPAPKPPTGLKKASRDAWFAWMGAWFAWFWTPEDLPGLRQVVQLYDELEQGKFQRASELRLQMEAYGMTPKGQQDRRWMPKPVKEPSQRPAAARRHLRAIDPEADTG